MRWIWLMLAIALSAVLWALRPTALLQWLEPGFQVTEIHPAHRTMTLRRANHSYLVRCDDACATFHSGDTYHMRIVGEQIRYDTSQEHIVLPIIEEEVRFTTPGGHG